MSLNYALLKESKEELIHELLSYFEHIVNLSNETYEYLKDHNIVDNEFIEKINLAEEKSDILYDDVLKSAIWIIQRNQPRASSLRFVISCINSSKELERTSDYILLIAKFLKKREIDANIHYKFMIAFKKCINLLNDSYNSFKEDNAYESRKKIKIALSEYEFFLKDHTREIIKDFYLKDINANSHKTLIDLINALNSLERIVTHIYNVIKSFSYIDL